MTKQMFLNNVRALYIVGNLSDSDSPRREDWTQPAMASDACCGALDKMLHAMEAAGVLSADELQAFYDDV